MKRYITTGSSVGDLDLTDIPWETAAVCHPADNEPRFSGLYNANGEPLYSIEETLPLGFDLVSS